MKYWIVKDTPAAPASSPASAGKFSCFARATAGAVVGFA
jgi:hypothetical protein